MSEEFVLSQVIDGVTKRSSVFSRLQVKRMMDALLYAKVKDYLPKRQREYNVIYKKIWEVKR